MKAITFSLIFISDIQHSPPSPTKKEKEKKVNQQQQNKENRQQNSHKGYGNEKLFYSVLKWMRLFFKHVEIYAVVTAGYVFTF